MRQICLLVQNKALNINFPDEVKTALESSDYDMFGRLMAHIDEIAPYFRVNVDVTKDKISISNNVADKPKIIDVYLNRRRIEIHSVPDTWYEQSEDSGFGYKKRLEEIFPDRDVKFMF